MSTDLEKFVKSFAELLRARGSVILLRAGAVDAQENDLRRAIYNDIADMLESAIEPDEPELSVGNERLRLRALSYGVYDVYRLHERRPIGRLKISYLVSPLGARVRKVAFDSVPGAEALTGDITKAALVFFTAYPEIAP